MTFLRFLFSKYFYKQLLYIFICVFVLFLTVSFTLKLITHHQEYIGQKYPIKYNVSLNQIVTKSAIAKINASLSQEIPTLGIDYYPGQGGKVEQLFVDAKKPEDACRMDDFTTNWLLNGLDRHAPLMTKSLNNRK